MAVGDDVYRQDPRKSSASRPVGEQNHRRRESPVKRFVRSPWLWIVVAVLGVLFALQYLAPSGGYDEIEQSTMNGYITSGQVKDLTLIDGDQTIKATLDDGVRPAGEQVTSHW